MKTLAQIIGAALVIIFGIHGMHHAILPAIALDAVSGTAKSLETISWNSSARVQPFVKTVMTMTDGQTLRTSSGKSTRRCVFPVSLERVRNERVHNTARNTAFIVHE